MVSIPRSSYCILVRNTPCAICCSSHMWSNDIWRIQWWHTTNIPQCCHTTNLPQTVVCESISREILTIYHTDPLLCWQSMFTWVHQPLNHVLTTIWSRDNLFMKPTVRWWRLALYKITVCPAPWSGNVLLLRSWPTKWTHRWGNMWRLVGLVSAKRGSAVEITARWITRWWCFTRRKCY